MDLMGCKGLRRWCASISMLLLLGMQNAWAINYNYPTAGGGTLAVAPQLLANNPDTLTISTSTTPFETPATGVTASTVYTVDFSAATTTNTTITVNSGGIISYAGTNGGAASINSARTDAGINTANININGEVSAGTGLYAIALKNTNTSPNDVYNINIGTTGSVIGTILANGVSSVGLNLTGNATITGVINLGVNSSGLSTLLVGASGSATFIPTESITNIGLLHLTNNSTMTLGTTVTTSNINGVTIDSGSTLNINSALVGLSTSDGNIVNNGTINIAAAITKTGTFSGTGTNVVTEGGSSGLSITTSNYRIKNHTTVMVDVNNYGNITLSQANFNLNNGGTNLFTVVYGTNGYSPGYLSGGTYTLVTTTTGTVTAPSPATLPASTLFLTFNNLTFNSTNIQVTITRTPFNTYGQSPLTQAVGQNLETIGSSSPPQSFVNLLNAVELSTNANQVESALRQLTPLANAPFYGFEIQNDSMYQVQLRLAELRNGSAHYFAGDIGVDNHPWIRGFGSYANQQPKDESYGYYGSSGGVAVGYDRDLDDRYTLGAAFAYALSHVTDKVNPNSVTDLKSYVGMIYGTYNYTNTSHLDWILAITANQFNANRYVNINNSFSAVATSSYSSQQLSVQGIWGQDYEAFGFMQLTPQALAQYTFSKQYAYQETGGGPTNLNISRKNTDIVTLGLGGIAAIPIWVDPSILMPDLHGWFYYNPIAGKQDTIFSFVQGGSPMSSYMNISRTGISIGAALTIAVVDQLEVKGNFDYLVQDRFNGWIAYLNLRYSL